MYHRGKDHIFSKTIYQTGAKPYKCSECGKEYVCKNHLKNHFSFHSEPQSGNGDSQFDCDKCGKTYQTELSLKVITNNYSLEQVMLANFTSLHPTHIDTQGECSQRRRTTQVPDMSGKIYQQKELKGKLNLSHTYNSSFYW